MGGHKHVVVILLALSAGSLSEPGLAGGSVAVDLQASSQTAPSPSGTSHKSSPATHHTTVAEEEGPPPELTKAEELIRKQNFGDAGPLLRKVVEADAHNYVAWFDLGFTENALGHLEESIAAYRKSVEAKPDVFESNLNLGLQLAKAHHPDAEQFLRAATQLKPTSHVSEGQARAWLSLGRVIEASKPDDALAAYGKAAALQPKDPEPHLASGLILEKENKFSDAEHEYQQALELDSSSLDAMTGLANIYMRGRRFPDAEAALRKVVAAHPEEAPARIQLGRVLAAESKNDEAIAELEAGQKLAPNDMTLQRDLVELYSTAGKSDKAEAGYRMLIAAHPNDAELHRGLGQSLLREKKFPAAEQEFVTALKLKPDLGEGYGDLAFAASENKEYQLVIKALDARLKFLPELPVTYFMRASAYDNMKQVKKAVENYHLFLNTANGKYPDQEWQAKHRLIALEPKR
jgi:Flp pilus assembly protein TadD